MLCRKYRQRRALQRYWNARRIREGLEDRFDVGFIERLDRADEAAQVELYERYRIDFYYARDRPPRDRRELEDFILESELRSLPDVGPGWTFSLHSDNPASQSRAAAA